MKIRPDRSHPDGIVYYELIDEEDYFYEVFVLVDNTQAKIIISDFGVSVDFRDGSSIHTNIIPNRIFKNQKKLSWENICRILKLLEGSSLEGKVYSMEEMQELFREWEESQKD